MNMHSGSNVTSRVAVIWIDWYPYHVARFEGLVESFGKDVVGIELVGGIGVHAGLKFREGLPADLRIETLMPDKSWSEANQWALSWKLWRRLSLLRPRIVLVPGYYTLPAIVASLWARLHGSESVLMAESTASDHTRTWWKEGLKSIAIRALFDWAVVGGRRHVEYLKSLRVPPERVTQFYDVVSNKLYSDGTKAIRGMQPIQFGLGGLAGPFFLYVGRLAAEKNVATLLESWITYRQDGGAWPLVLVGGGQDEATLRRKAQDSQYADQVFFFGHLSSHSLLPLLAFAGCFVLPSVREPWGLVVNEAMASALPVLVSQSCGCVEDLVQSGRNGFVFNPNDPGELAGLLARIASLTTEERLRMGADSEVIIRPFNPRNFGLSILGIAKACAIGRSSATAEDLP